MDEKDDIEIRDNSGGMDGFLEHLKQMKEKIMADHITAHYGEPDKFVSEERKKILADMILNEKRSEVLDKYFPELDGKGRLRVLAYAEAFVCNRRLDKNNGSD